VGLIRAQLLRIGTERLAVRELEAAVTAGSFGSEGGRVATAALAESESSGRPGSWALGGCAGEPGVSILGSVHSG
jgi:hypothetical protein